MHSKITKLLLLLVLAPHLNAQEIEPLVGAWRLDFSRSTFASGPAYSRVVCKIERWNDGLKVAYDMVGVRGGVTHWEWIGRVDGKDYPLEGIEEVATNAYTRTSDRSYDVVFKIDGRITSTTKIVISPDGKTMTVTSSASNIAIYTKR